MTSKLLAILVLALVPYMAMAVCNNFIIQEKKYIKNGGIDAPFVTKEACENNCLSKPFMECRAYHFGTTHDDPESEFYNTTCVFSNRIEAVKRPYALTPGGYFRVTHYIRQRCDGARFCDSLPCQNNGVCNEGRKRCTCAEGYTGEFCERECEENADCSDNLKCGSNYKCVECDADSDCAADKPKCDANYKCVDCEDTFRLSEGRDFIYLRWWVPVEDPATTKEDCEKNCLRKPFDECQAYHFQHEGSLTNHETACRHSPATVKKTRYGPDGNLYRRVPCRGECLVNKDCPKLRPKCNANFTCATCLDGVKNGQFGKIIPNAVNVTAYNIDECKRICYQKPIEECRSIYYGVSYSGTPRSGARQKLAYVCGYSNGTEAVDNPQPEHVYPYHFLRRDCSAEENQK